MVTLPITKNRKVVVNVFLVGRICGCDIKIAGKLGLQPLEIPPAQGLNGPDYKAIISARMASSDAIATTAQSKIP